MVEISETVTSQEFASYFFTTVLLTQKHKSSKIGYKFKSFQSIKKTADGN